MRAKNKLFVVLERFEKGRQVVMAGYYRKVDIHNYIAQGWKRYV